MPGLRLGETDHVLPFNDSMRVRGAVRLFAEVVPTAMHEVVEVHDTPVRYSTVPGLGLWETDHVLPFHDSMRVSLTVVDEEEPTATHEVVEAHDTPSRPSKALVPPGLGLEENDQVVPFHDSTRVWV